ncbi:hypothetical protein [Cryobacterium sp. GrIS_2_6]|uniref:hypothetical protein n=1 Tax=Cryobacterium sp. GrIS_2_6 TaxID=3162785 RepID=UPI002E065868|nr:hypothetical protein [Cryobacterium psychrotolerans]MEC5149241.1 hypothetical protein [Cryobacterium psychrotolerans]MEC5149319.1 hypothetical protein [Cryobacterium psychrotolerans]
MNPWEIVSWIGAICTGVIIITLTVGLAVAVAVAPFKTEKTAAPSTVNIFKGHGGAQ